MMDGVRFGRIIKNERIKRGISCRQLAQMAKGISLTYLVNIEKGELESPSIKKCAQIADALGCDVVLCRRKNGK